MNWKPVVYRDHAVRRLRERDITRRDVRQLLATGNWTPQGTNRWLVDGVLEGCRARLAVHEDARQITVMTAMWID